MKYLFTILIIGISFNSYGLTKNQKAKLKFYQPVIDLLSHVEEKKEIESLILDNKVRFQKGLILLNMNQPSQKDYFKNSLTKKYVNKGKRFLKRHYKFLSKIEKKYKVEKEIIVAILYIETNFNLKRAKNYVFNAFSSLVFADNPDIIKTNLSRLEKKFKNYPKSYINEQKRLLVWRSESKAKWAKNELKLLFKVARQMKKPILSIKGSFAGAMGWPQFIPSSYLKYGVDGNGDKKIDLFSLYDSIASIANYLKKEGYSSDIRDKRKAIHHYNRSWGYVRFVISYAEKLKQK